MEIDNVRDVAIPVTLKDGQDLRYMGGEEANIYNKNWQKVGRVEVTRAMQASVKHHIDGIQNPHGGTLQPLSFLTVSQQFLPTEVFRKHQAVADREVNIQIVATTDSIDSGSPRATSLSG